MRNSFQYKNIEFCMGPFMKCPYPEMVECCALAGFDFAIADMEHTAITPKELYPLLLAATARGTELIVRIPENSEKYFKWCLDLGVRYIQVPHIQSKGDAENAVRSSRFAPSGGRGLCRFVRAADYSETNVQEYISNSSPRLILQIEGINGLSNLDQILSVEGIDTIFVGPYDLSQSLGYPGQVWHPKVTEGILEIIEKCKRANIRVGTFADSPESIFTWVSKGATMIQYASDINLFFSGVQTLKSGLKHEA